MNALQHLMKLRCVLQWPHQKPQNQLNLNKWMDVTRICEMFGMLMHILQINIFFSYWWEKEKAVRIKQSRNCFSSCGFGNILYWIHIEEVDWSGVNRTHIIRWRVIRLNSIRSFNLKALLQNSQYGSDWFMFLHFTHESDFDRILH